MKKKVVLSLGSLALVGAIAVGGTLAYLSSVTETKKNVFSGSNGIHGELTETEWNEDEASNYYPGKVIAKNPQIVNDMNSSDAYVAVTVNFIDTTKGTNLTYKEFLAYASVDFNKTDWKKVDTNFKDKTLVYMYNNVLAPGAATKELFTEVTINTGIQTVIVNKKETGKVYKEVEQGTEGAEKKEDGKYYVLVKEDVITVESTDRYVVIDGEKISNAETVLPSFHIDVQGYMVQTEFDDKKEDESNKDKAQTELLKMISAKHTAPSTSEE